MKSTSEPSFTFVDKRGQNRAEEEAPPQAEEHGAISISQKKTWKEVCYRFDIVRLKDGLGVVCIAVGERGDGKPFCASYLTHPLDINDGVDWKPLAKKRLDTFLGCDCSISRGQCGLHKLSTAQWARVDEQRYMKISAHPVPRPLEILSRAVQAHQAANIILQG